MIRLATAMVFTAILTTQPAQAEESAPTLKELYSLLKAQQAEIQALKKQLAENQNTSAQALAVAEDVDEKIELVASETEAAIDKDSSLSKTRIGGYGELHYNFLTNQLSGGDDIKTVDFHRFVTFFSHQFTDRIAFVAELELEHALSGDGKPGEVELEQAYLEFKHDANRYSRAGVMLLPIGLLNETHEPDTFYGVERNNVEKYIVPSTWWEAGYAYHQQWSPTLSMDLAVTSGLKLSENKNYAIRSGRQKVALADMDSPALTARMRWKPQPALEISASLFAQGDMGQDSLPDLGSGLLFNTHINYQPAKGPGIRALYAQWNLEGDAPEAIGADQQFGYYLEPNWRLNHQWGVFGRYSVWDNMAGEEQDSEYSQWDLGINYWPTAQVVFKLDYQNQNSPLGKNEFDGFNLGMGYQF